MQKHRVRALLMGGQACVFYGAAEFSRDVDFAVLADDANFARLKKSLRELKAESIAVPPDELKYLRRGHALHFRCFHPDTFRIRVDVMSRMRGVDSFANLWKRRTTLRIEKSVRCQIMSLEDLVAAKKTQRDKDWPMIRRLVEVHYIQHRDNPDRKKTSFWLMELRTPEFLIEAANAHGKLARKSLPKRTLLAHAISGHLRRLEAGLATEEKSVRAIDKKYWSPLKKELEKLRHARC